MSDSEITELLNELSTPKHSHLKRHRSQVQEMPLLTEEQDSPQNLLLKRKYEHLLRQYLDLKKKLDEHNFQKQVVLAQVQNDQEKDVFYSLDSQKNEFQYQSSPKKIFLPLKKVEVPRTLIFSQASRKTDYMKGNTIPYCSELFNQISSLISKPHFSLFKDIAIERNGVIFKNSELSISLSISDVKKNKIDAHLIYQCSVKLEFLDLQDYSDSSEFEFRLYYFQALQHGIFPNRFEDLVAQALYRQKISITIKEIPFTFVEMTGEYEGNKHFRIVVPATILNFCQWTKEEVFSGECLKLSVYNFNVRRFQRFQEVFQVGSSFGVRVFDDQRIGMKMSSNGRKLKLVCFPNGNVSSAQQLMNTMHFLFSN